LCQKVRGGKREFKGGAVAHVCHSRGWDLFREPGTQATQGGRKGTRLVAILKFLAMGWGEGIMSTAGKCCTAYFERRTKRRRSIFLGFEETDNNGGKTESVTRKKKNLKERAGQTEFAVGSRWGERTSRRLGKKIRRGTGIKFLMGHKGHG